MPSRLSQPITLKRPSLPRRSHRAASGRNLVGLDVEPGQIVAASVRAGGPLEIQEVAGMPLSPEVVRDGEVTDVAALSGALRELFDASKLDTRVRLGVANQRVVVRTLELPPIADPKELATAVRFQAQDEIPMPLDSVVMDFHTLGVVNTPNGPRQQIVLVAARRDMVERLLAAARDAGLRPEGVDVAGFAMIRALRVTNAPAGERVLYLAIGGLTNLAVADGNACQFSRVIGGGVEQIVAEVAERCAVPIHEARRLIGATEDLGTLPAEGGSASKADVACDALFHGIQRIAAEVNNSLEFNRTQGGREVSRAVLCGAALDIPSFDRVLETALGMPVTAGHVPLARTLSTDVPVSRMTIAAGLALAETRS